MREAVHSGLSAQEALCLHRRLLERDPLAWTDFAAAFLKPLIAWLESHHPTADPAVCAEAADEAIIQFLNKPAAYDPERLEVEAFLRMVAQRDLQNLQRKERRHQKNRRGWNFVEHAAEEGKYLGREDDPSLPLQIEEARRRRAPPPAVWERMDDRERRVWEAMEQGEQRNAVFAEILGVTHLPAEEQERAVKRVKDRLKKRLERAGGKRDRSH